MREGCEICKEKTSNRSCYDCGALLCDDCDKGTERDEVSLCPSCKEYSLDLSHAITQLTKFIKSEPKQ